ncbi:hypothetical protein RF11_13109 [Thelohanellus kitauei]|uniref:Uncharacterized protein n=1 Tax=Thelohanellus kitauei TaxID=669202 RepID=A0A0C2J9J6_THEKT|nr:hypothetical protein RF11_13109 [Thelohanellus kitauei]
MYVLRSFIYVKSDCSYCSYIPSRNVLTMANSLHLDILTNPRMNLISKFLWLSFLILMQIIKTLSETFVCMKKSFIYNCQFPETALIDQVVCNGQLKTFYLRSLNNTNLAFLMIQKGCSDADISAPVQDASLDCSDIYVNATEDSFPICRPILTPPSITCDWLF